MSVGAVVEGGYNASKFVNFADEVWSRVRFSYAVGSSDESFFAFEITPDAVFYVLDNLGVFIQSGVSYARVSRPASPDVDGSPSVGGGTFGFVAGSGLDFAWDEDWSSRLGATYRLGFSDVVLENGLRAGNLSALLVGASLGYTF